MGSVRVRKAESMNVHDDQEGESRNTNDKRYVIVDWINSVV